jgi:hypothetical protein
MKRAFPVLAQAQRCHGYDGPSEVPWDLVAPHEAQALRNHHQTLDKLADRGGLDPIELLDVLQDRLVLRRETNTADAYCTQVRAASAELRQLLAARAVTWTGASCDHLEGDRQPHPSGRDVLCRRCGRSAATGTDVWHRPGCAFITARDERTGVYEPCSCGAARPSLVG